jgi:hypothetical protein
MDITIDIETIPCQKPAFLVELLEKHQEAAEKEAQDVNPPRNYKSADTIEKWWQETGLAARDAIRACAEASATAEYRQTSLDGAFGQIAVIGYAIGDDDPRALWQPAYAESEKWLLGCLYQALSEAQRNGAAGCQLRIVGHNVANFDLRFILQRSIVNGIRPPTFMPFNAKPWEQDKVFDTMTAWAGVGGKVKLDKLCKALGLPGKPNNIDGSKVWDFVEAGQIADVADYCIDDVIQTRECFKRMTFAD